MAIPERRETKPPAAASDALEMLARCRPVSREAFQRILANPEAVRRLRRLLKVRDIFIPPDEVGVPRPTEFAADVVGPRLPDEEVDFVEIARYLNEGRLDDPRRQQALEQLIREHFPDLPPLPESTAQTEVDFRRDDETKIDPRPNDRRS